MVSVCTWLLLLLTLPYEYAAAQPAKQQKQDPNALRSAAQTAVAKGDSATAIRLYSQLLSVEPSQINYFQRASLYTKKHHHPAALSDLNAAIKLDPKFLKGLIYRAKVLKVTGACDKALEDVRQVLSQQPSHKEALNERPKIEQCVQLSNQAKSFFDAKQYDAARHFLTQAMDIAYQSNSLLLLRAKVAASMDDWQSVLVDTRKILHADKTDLETLLIRGKAYYMLGEYDNALNHWKEGLRSDPEHKALKAETKRLRLLLRRISNAESSLDSNPKESLEELEMALEMMSSPEEEALRQPLLIKKSHALRGLKRYPEAISLLNPILEQDPEQIDALLARAEARLAAEEYEQAVHDFQHASNIDPHNQEVHQRLHHAELSLKKSKQKDYYKELGVAKDATPRQIKKAYRKLAIKWHPDKHESSTEKEEATKKFHAIGEAYEVLSDPEMRAKYDRGELEQGGGGHHHHHHHHHGHGFPFGFGGGGGGGQQTFHFRFG